MKPFKMLCLDIDGTLLNSRHELTEGVKTAIRSAVQMESVRVVLVSARMPRGMGFLQEALGIDGPMICFSGAMIWDKGRILDSKFIPVEATSTILDVCKAIGAHISLYKGDAWHVESLDEWAKQEGEITGIRPIEGSHEGLIEDWSAARSGPNKILCMALPLVIEQLRTRLGEEPMLGSLNIYPSKPTYLEIMPAGADKPAAIDALCARWQIDRSEVMSIGDNYNDITMLEFAGLGIAMGNAPEAVKGHADAVTSTNDEDGVAVAIRKYIMGNVSG